MLSGYTLGIVPGHRGYAAALGADGGMLLLRSARAWHPPSRDRVFYGPGLGEFLVEAERRMGPCLFAYVRISELGADERRTWGSTSAEERNREAVERILYAHEAPLRRLPWTGSLAGQEAAAAEAEAFFGPRGWGRLPRGGLAWRSQLAAVLAGRAAGEMNLNRREVAA